MEGIWQNAHRSARGDAARHSTTNRACSSAKNAVQSAYACLQATMEIKMYAPATTTGRPSVEDPNALRFLFFFSLLWEMLVSLGH